MRSHIPECKTGEHQASQQKRDDSDRKRRTKEKRTRRRTKIMTGHHQLLLLLLVSCHEQITGERKVEFECVYFPHECVCEFHCGCICCASTVCRTQSDGYTHVFINVAFVVAQVLRIQTRFKQFLTISAKRLKPIKNPQMLQHWVVFLAVIDATAGFNGLGKYVSLGGASGSTYTTPSGN